MLREKLCHAPNGTVTNLMITQSKKSVRRPFCVTYEKSGKRLCDVKTRRHDNKSHIISVRRISNGNKPLSDPEIFRLSLLVCFFLAHVLSTLVCQLCRVKSLTSSLYPMCMPQSSMMFLPPIDTRMQLRPTSCPAPAGANRDITDMQNKYNRNIENVNTWISFCS